MFNIFKDYTKFTMIYHFYWKEWKLKKSKKFVANLHNKTEYVIHIRNLKQALNYGLALEKVHRVIKFNQNAYLKPYDDMSTEKSKKWFLGNLWKMWENIEILNLPQ